MRRYGELQSQRGNFQEEEEEDEEIMVNTIKALIKLKIGCMKGKTAVSGLYHIIKERELTVKVFMIFEAVGSAFIGLNRQKTSTGRAWKADRNTIWSWTMRLTTTTNGYSHVSAGKSYGFGDGIRPSLDGRKCSDRVFTICSGYERTEAISDQLSVNYGIS
ncbi:unnamed protein product [Dibothriocephalus latus]|uniref:Uncharacterized protein n=1 Tax=Dibothriocephalus latus TaxID=60516 RepID=A0A3P6PMN1_DIBLA|nr:unnamed protein product [Dibothriocephalus latus]